MGKGKISISDAWEEIFLEQDILRTIERKGFFEITAKEIKKKKEPRLMAKFDHSVNLPKIFKENQLMILPNSRSSYVIGNFNGYQKLAEDAVEIDRVQLPTNFDTLDINHIYSESAAIHCINAVSIFDNIFGESFKHTISGRMGTGNFGFNIDIENHAPMTIEVANSQCEIDAGYESKNAVILVEAKNTKPDDFLIRQLYYPYRRWENMTHKPIIPVFMTYSNDIFDFYIYEFKDKFSYNSLDLQQHRRYTVEEYKMSKKRVLELLDMTTPKQDTMDTPFPQADSFERVTDLLRVLKDAPRTPEYLSTNYQFVGRQSDYYFNATKYLGLAEKSKVDGKIFCQLTEKGETIMELSLVKRNEAIIQSLIEHEFFHYLVKIMILHDTIPDKNWIVNVMQNYTLKLSKDGDTPKRRASTVLHWLNWIRNTINN